MADTNIERGTGRLLYQQIIDAMMEQIRSGSFSYDKPICTESELMEHYGVSRITVRRALTELEDKGILYRKRGVGSFVCQDIYQKSDFIPPAPTPSVEPGSPLFAFVLPFNISRTGLTGTYLAASAYLTERGCMTSIYISEDSGENRARFILDRLSQMNVAGVAYYPYSSNIHQQSVDRLMLAGKSVVLMDIPSPCKHLASVSCDNLSGSMELTRYLISLGHTRIAFLTGISSEQRVTISDRYSGYMLALSEAGIQPVPDFVCMEMTQAARELPAGDPGSLSSVVSRFYKSGVTAIISEHDGIACQVLQTCHDLGLRVPEDISVCGFDKSEWVTMNTGMSITTAAQDYQAIGRTVAEQLYEGRSKPLCVHEPIIIPMTLTIGNTTGPAPIFTDTPH